MEDMELLKDLEKLVKKELKKNVEKGTISPPEMDSIHKAVETLEGIAKTEKICKELESMEKMEKNPDMYSGAFYNIRNFPQMPPPPSYNSYGMHHDWTPEMDYSGERGRSMRTGRFVSRDDRTNRMHDNYSGHSINDRMVDQLEKMMDTANSEFERQQILDKIKMIRNSSDRMG